MSIHIPPHKDLEAELLVNLSEAQLDDPPSIWELLPSQVYRKLFKKLDIGTKKLIREVCTSWKTALEIGSGLRVKIDDRIPENKEFISKIKIVEARVLHLGNVTPQEQFFTHPGSLNKLILAGPINPFWFMEQMPSFDNLKKLVIRGGFMTTHVLQDGSINIPQSIILPSMKSLEIVINEFSFPFYIPLIIRLREPERALQNDRSFFEMALKVGKNIAFLLATLRCPKLHMLQIYSYEKPGFVLPPSDNWRSHPLELFLEYHRETLRELYLPEFEGKHSLDHEEREYPSNLSKLSIMLNRTIGDREEDRQQNSTYWKSLISNQSKLKAIDIQIVNMDHMWIIEAVSSFAMNSKSFLTYLDLSLQVEDQFELNCGIFSECSNLEVLRISCREVETLITNFHRLPASLKKVRFHLCFIQLPVVEDIHKFKNLVMLELGTLVLDEVPHVRALNLVKELLYLRSLDYLGISFDQSVGGSIEFRIIIENFSSFWDQRFRYTSMRVNQDYQWQVGWSEEVFDELDNGRDTLGHREPEHLASWESLIGIEEDPRVVLFHNLPMLIGGFGFENDDDVDDDDNSSQNSPDNEHENDPDLLDDDEDDW